VQGAGAKPDSSSVSDLSLTLSDVRQLCVTASNQRVVRTYAFESQPTAGETRCECLKLLLPQAAQLLLPVLDIFS